MNITLSIYPIKKMSQKGRHLWQPEQRKKIRPIIHDWKNRQTIRTTTDQINNNEKLKQFLQQHLPEGTYNIQTYKYAKTKTGLKLTRLAIATIHPTHTNLQTTQSLTKRKWWNK